MATWDDVRAAALDLPGVTERVGGEGLRSWRVRDKLIVWERPLRKADLAALGAAAPTGPTVGFHTVDLVQKDEILAARPDVFFTTPHFDGHNSVLLRGSRVGEMSMDELAGFVEGAWLSRAGPRAVARWMKEHGA